MESREAGLPEPYDTIAILDTKIEDALRRRRQGGGHEETVAMRLAIDQTAGLLPDP